MCFMIPIIMFMVSWPVADGCAYGPGCRFPCRCEHGGCDPITGECDSRRCEQVRPTGYEFGWKSIGCRLGNIAYGKAATQRGQHNNNVAEWAVDGDTNPRLWGNSCAHPALKDGQPAWWMVDLGQKYIIEEIVIFNRNAYRERTDDFYIRIGMTSTIHEQELCIYYNGGAKDILRLTCKGPVRKGRYVSMARRQGSWDFEEMNICEFVVLGYEPIICSPRCVGTCDTLTGCETCSPGYQMPDCIDECKPYFWGTNCLKYCGKCAYNQPCDKVNGVCEHGCKLWYLNSKCDIHIVAPSLLSTPVRVHTISSSSIQVTWRQFAVPYNLEEYYFYRVSLKFPAGGTKQSAKIKHDSDVEYQSFNTDGLEYNTEYKVTVIPYRVYNNIEEAGEMSIEGQNKTLCIAPVEPSIFVNVTHETWIIGVQAKDDIVIGCDTITSYDLYVGSADRKDIIHTQSVLDQAFVLIPLNASYHGFSVWTVVRNNERLTAKSTNVRLLYTVSGDEASVLNQPVIIGCGIGLLVVILLLIVLIVIRARFTRKKSLKSSSSDNGPVTSTADLSRNESINMAIINDTDNVYENAEKLDFSTSCVPVSQMALYIQQKQLEADGFKREYSTIPEGVVHPVTKASEGNNLTKNRFKNIKAYDKSRVVLHTENEDPSTDYINASFLPGYNGNTKYYIAGQGPLPHTIADTWRMLWQYDVTRVVMVTKENESGKQKCERYWPKTVGAVTEYGNLTITLNEIEEYADFTIRKIFCSDSRKTKKVTQFHFTSWPDKQALDIALPLLQFRHKVQSDPEAGPMFVHCSAGIGRTGTYIAIDYLINQGLSEHKIDVHHCVKNLREYRMNMVQTLAQYESIYKALFEAFTFCDPIACGDLDARLEGMGTAIPQQHQNITQWINTLKSNNSDYDGLKAENKMKNRDNDIIPGDMYRPYLKTPMIGRNDYINAVFINSYRRKRAYIVTQFPLPSTVIDFWRLVYDHKCGVVVTLGNLETQEDQESNASLYYNVNNATTASWLPDSVDKPVNHGPLAVTMTSLAEVEGLTIKNIQVKLTKIKGGISTTHISLSDFYDGGLPHLDRFIKLLKNVEELRVEKVGPVLIQCLNGADKSGLMVAAMYMAEYIKLEQEVDVVNAVRSVKKYRKQFVNNKNQYEFLYKVAQSYNNMFSTYANM